MYIDFEEMPDNARIWFYQADRVLSEEEADRISSTLQDKLDIWLTHGMPMKGSFRIISNRIILIAADVNFQSPSGCSIDSSARWLQELGETLGLNLFDRSFGIVSEEGLNFVSFMGLKKHVESGEIKPETRVLNSQVATKGDLDSLFFIPASETYIKRYFPVVEAH